MDEEEIKKYPSLPPDYVSLAQLQKRWLQKQEENKLKEKQEREVQQETQNLENENQNRRGVKNHGFEKMEGHSIRNMPRGRVEKDDREMGVIEEKEKRKGLQISGFGNGEENKKKKNKKKYRRKKKCGADEEKGNEATLNGFDGYTEKNGIKGVGVNPRDEVKVEILGSLSGESSGREGICSALQGNEETVSVCMVEVLPKNGGREENPGVLTARNVRRVEFRGGFRINGNNRGAGYKSKECRVKMHELKDKKMELALEKMEDEVLEIDRKGHYKKWREKRTNRDDQVTDYELKERRDKMCEVTCSIVVLNSEKKADDEISDVGSGRDGMKGRDKNGFDRRDRRNEIEEHRVEGEGLNDNRVALEKNVEDKGLVDENAKNGENGGVGNGFRTYENYRGNIGRKIGNFAFNNWRGNMNVGGNRRYASFRRFEDGQKVKQMDSGMMWVKKEEKMSDNAAEVGSSGISLGHE